MPCKSRIVVYATVVKVICISLFCAYLQYDNYNLKDFTKCDILVWLVGFLFFNYYWNEFMKINKKAIFIVMLSMSMYIEPSMRRILGPVMSVSSVLEKYPKAVFFLWNQPQRNEVNCEMKKDAEREEVILQNETSIQLELAKALAAEYNALQKESLEKIVAQHAEEACKLQNFAKNLSMKYEKKGDKQVGAQPAVMPTCEKFSFIDWNKVFYPDSDMPELEPVLTRDEVEAEKARQSVDKWAERDWSKVYIPKKYGKVLPVRNGASIGSRKKGPKNNIAAVDNNKYYDEVNLLNKYAVESEIRSNENNISFHNWIFGIQSKTCSVDEKNYPSIERYKIGAKERINASEERASGENPLIYGKSKKKISYKTSDLLDEYDSMRR